MRRRMPKKGCLAHTREKAGGPKGRMDFCRNRGSGGKEPIHLLLDALINVFVGTENVNHILVLNQLFNDEGRDIQADDVGMGGNPSHGGALIIDLKVIGLGHSVQTLIDLLLEAVFAEGFDESVFNQFHGDCVRQRLDMLLDGADGDFSGMFLAGFDFRQDAAFPRAGSEHFCHGTLPFPSGLLYDEQKKPGLSLPVVWLS